MKFILQKVNLLFYFFGSLLLMDILFKSLTLGKIVLMDIMYSFLFNFTISLLLWAICIILSKNINYLFSLLFMFIFGIIYSSQFIYYKIFKTFYILYSFANGTQVLEFWRDILFIIKANFFYILLFFIPGFLLLLFGRKLFTYQRDRRFSIIAFLLVLFFHSLTIGTLYIGGTHPQSPLDLYLTGDNSIVSIEKFGLLTTMRLDIQRLAFGSSYNFLVSSELSEKEEEPLQNSDIEEVEEEKKTYNTMDIDFESLLQTEKDEKIRDMHKFFNAVRPTEKNEFTGIYKGYNLIFLTAEGFSPYAVRSDVTPTLYKMVHKGYHFTNFYTPFWDISTTDGEYVACTGLLPKSGVWSFYESSNNYMPFAIGNQLNLLGYKSMAYHNHSYDFYKRNESHPNMGYIYKGVGNGLKVRNVWPASDLEMVQNTVDEYINNQPFHAYYMTVSGHLRYSFNGNSMALKNKDLVQDLPYSEESKAYIATQIELDRALKYLTERLEEADMADNTLIVLSADHYPYGLDKKSINELADHQVEENFELYKSNLIIYTKGMEPTTVDKLSSSVDIIPTISNLLGLEYDSRLLVGKDIFSNIDPLVIFSDKSFITEKGKFNYTTKDFTPVHEGSLEKGYIEKISRQVDTAFSYSASILDYDYYGKVFDY